LTLCEGGTLDGVRIELSGLVYSHYQIRSQEYCRIWKVIGTTSTTTPPISKREITPPYGGLVQHA
jgi:hypothetical protein